MNYKAVVSVAIAATLLVKVAVISAGDADENYWLKKHAVIKTTETQDRDDNGNVISSRKVKTTQISIVQTCTETKKLDKFGNLVLAGRVTDTTDTFGGRVQIVESRLPGSYDLVTTAITTVQVVPGLTAAQSSGIVVQNTITTVQNRSTNGTMRIVSRTTTMVNPDGTISTTVETLDKQGRLVPKQTTNQN
jgi:hypothetical protein